MTQFSGHDSNRNTGYINLFEIKFTGLLKKLQTGKGFAGLSQFYVREVSCYAKI